MRIHVCGRHFIKKLVALCYDDAMKLGGRDGHVEGCLKDEKTAVIG